MIKIQITFPIVTIEISLTYIPIYTCPYILYCIHELIGYHIQYMVYSARTRSGRRWQTSMTCGCCGGTVAVTDGTALKAGRKPRTPGSSYTVGPDANIVPAQG